MIIAFAVVKFPAMISSAFFAFAIPCVPELVVCITVLPLKLTFFISKGEFPYSNPF